MNQCKPLPLPLYLVLNVFSDLLSDLPPLILGPAGRPDAEPDPEPDPLPNPKFETDFFTASRQGWGDCIDVSTRVDVGRSFKVAHRSHCGTGVKR